VILAYDKEGKAMTLAEWSAKMNDMAYRRIAFDTVEEMEVSTVWLGLDNSFGGPTPLIFETMVFGDRDDEHQRRYATKAEALAGHAEVLRDLRNRVYP
jgi:hypothetical protein